ncbi:DUF4403 family protein [Cetobacterium sp.]|uniref:DUF4403 family protein n=1 Tax=Cetobacterium sp. TaxID=2071632 RepID=UPI003F2B4BFE
MKKTFLYFIILNSIIGFSLFSEENRSKVDLDISLRKSVVENIINKQLPNLIEDSGSGSEIFNGHKNGILGTGLSLLGAIDKKFSQSSESFIWTYKINRSPILFSAKGQEVEAITDISGLFKASWSRNKDGTEMILNGNAGIKSTVSISPDWKLETNSSPFLNISNKSIPLNLDVYGLKLKTDINIGDSLEKSISSKLKKATKELDEKIGAFDLKSIVEKNWIKLKDPILINQDYNLWLTVDPKSARYSDMVSSTDDLSIKVGADVDLNMFFGDKPETLQLKNLPEMNFGFVDDNFNIVLPILADYSNLNNIINSNLKDKDIKITSAITSNISDVNLSSENKTFFIKGDFKLSIFSLLNPKGTITAHLKPTFDKATHTLNVDNFDYVLQSDSFVLNLLNKLFENKVKDIIQKKYLNFNSAKEVGVLKIILEEKVKNIELDKNVYLKSSIDNLTIDNLNINDEFLSLTFRVIGKSTIEIVQN